MILLLNTSTETCELMLIDDTGQSHDGSWIAGRELARQLPGKIEALLTEQSANWNDITGIGLYRGPGSFTGLRIGCTVMNTIAHEQLIPIVGVTGDTWQSRALQRLESGENDQLVMPYYDRPANITSPKR